VFIKLNKLCVGILLQTEDCTGSPFYMQDMLAVSTDCSMAAYWYTYNCKWAKHV